MAQHLTRNLVGAAALTVFGVGTAQAVPLVDGSKDVEYGAALAVQANPTGFGDSTTGAVASANGSELDAAYGFISGGNLHLFLAGNLQTNFNKIEVFIDSTAGGQNRLRGDNADVDFNGLNRMGDNTGTPETEGLRFDAGFEPDFYITAGGGGDGPTIFANYATLPTSGGGSGFFLGSTSYGSNGALAGAGAGAPAIALTIDNRNAPGSATAPLGGVTGLTAPNDAALVTTGIELQIPLSAIGDPTGPINITAFINGSGHDFVSNQFLGSLATGTGNLGDPRNVDLTAQPGLQFFTVVPEPATAGMLVMGGLALLARRGRRTA